MLCTWSMKLRVLLLAICCWIPCSRTLAQQAPLDRAEILGRLAEGYSPSYLAQLVKARGVSFSASADFLEQVKLAGGEGILVERLANAASPGESSASHPERGTDFLGKCAEWIHIGAASLAEKDCRGALEENPESPWPIMAALHVLALNSGSAEERVALLRRAVALDPGLADAHRALAVADIPAVERATEMQAAQLSGETHREDEFSSGAFAGELPLNAGADDDANFTPEGRQALLARIQRELAEKGEWAGVRLSVGLTYAQLGEQDHAANEIREAIRLEPGNADLHIALATFYGKQHDVNSALAEYREAVRIAPYDCAYRRLIADNLVRENRHEEAIQEWKDYLLLSPRDQAASSSLVNLHLARHDRSSAIGELRRTLKASSDATPTESAFLEDRYRDLDRLARLLAETLQFDAATEQYAKLLRFRPYDAMLHVRLGNVFYAQRLCEQASGEYREAIRLQPGLAEAHHHLGNCLLFAQRADDAMAEYRQSLELEPDKEESRILLGAALCAKGELNSAIEEFEQVLGTDPDNAVVLANMGHAFYLNKDYPAAIAALRRAVSLKPDFTAAKEELALAVRPASSTRTPRAALDALTEALLLGEGSMNGLTTAECNSGFEAETVESPSPAFPGSNH
jgi:tetratricopeptide (TPR) repeat protein